MGTMSGTKITNYNFENNNKKFSSIELTSAGSKNWVSLDMSDDGNILLAGVHGGYFYVSKDSGDTWNELNFTYSSWKAITVSSNGSTLIAGGHSVGPSGGSYTDTALRTTYLYVSNDYGNTWNVAITPSKHWNSSCSSADGNILYACSKDYNIHKSIDSGNTWTQLTASGVKAWVGIDCSSDGTKLIAVAYGNYIYTSSNSGTNWTSRITSIGTRFWSDCAITKDGTKLFAVVNGNSSNYNYYSLNSGTSWTAKEQPGNDIRRGEINTSNDGSIICVGKRSHSYVTISYDYGSTWTDITSFNFALWFCPVLSGDGKIIFTGEYGGLLYKITGF